MKKGVIISIVIALIIILPIAWYLISPLFLNEIIVENFPYDDLNDSEDNNQTQTQIQKIKQGQFQDADDFHKVSGQATIFELENGTQLLRLENFESTNGPDLKVWLTTDTTAEDYVALGPLKGNIGNQTYTIPKNTDLDKYDNALIWCEQFSVLFGSAELE